MNKWKTMGLLSGTSLVVNALRPGAAAAAAVGHNLTGAAPSVAQVAVAVALVLLVVLLLRAAFRWPPAMHLSVALLMGVGAWYLWWRATSTLVLHAPVPAVASLLLFGAECYGFVSLLLFYIQTWSPVQRGEPPPLEHDHLPTVDVLVTIFDEPVDVLHRTLVGCKALRYPEEKKRIYVLDDSHRDEIRDLAGRLGCHYLSRATNEHAKAGNLNEALKQINGDLVVNFDTDHVPVSTFLERTVGYFQDPKVGLVQTAHHFYNPDPYQETLRLTNEIVHEQELFFQVIQPGRDRYNAAFFCGSGGVFRRSVLDAVGGFVTTSTTEDIHTTIRLHAAGFRSIYVKERLAAGLSPESFDSYLRQRERWAQGHAQILFTRENPMWVRGLSLMQRIAYAASISYFFNGIPRIIFLTAPLMYLLFDTPPLAANIWMLAVYFVPYYVASLLVFHAVSGHLRNPFWSDVYESASSFAVTAATVRAFLFPRNTTFYVTPKGVRRLRNIMAKGILPHLVLAALLLVGIAWVGYKYLLGTADPQAFAISAIWAGYNLLIVTAAISVARQRPQLRSAPRLVRRMGCQLSFNSHRLDATVLDLSETGLSLTMAEPIRLPPAMDVTIRGDNGERTTINARLVRNDRDDAGRIYIALEYVGLTEAQHQSVLRQMYCHPNAWHAPVAPIMGFWPSFALLLTSGFRAFFHETLIRRFSPRVRAEFRCDLLVNGEWQKGLTEDIGLDGLSVRVMESAPSGHPLRQGPVQCRLYPGNGRGLQSSGKILWVRRNRTQCVVGILLVNFNRREHETLWRLGGHAVPTTSKT